MKQCNDSCFMKQGPNYYAFNLHNEETVKNEPKSFVIIISPLPLKGSLLPPSFHYIKHPHFPQNSFYPPRLHFLHIYTNDFDNHHHSLYSLSSTFTMNIFHILSNCTNIINTLAMYHISHKQTTDKVLKF